jgi:hypothetical protein
MRQPSEKENNRSDSPTNSAILNIGEKRSIQAQESAKL